MSGDRQRPRLTPQGGTSQPGGARTPSLPAGRAGRPQPSLLQVSWRLLRRDYTLALLLDDHRVLTTEQITAVLFGSARTCRNRLTVLRRIGFLDRFTLPRRPGRQALECWLPGLLAAGRLSAVEGRYRDILNHRPIGLPPRERESNPDRARRGPAGSAAESPPSSSTRHAGGARATWTTRPDLHRERPPAHHRLPATHNERQT